jgi:phage-related protein
LNVSAVDRNTPLSRKTKNTGVPDLDLATKRYRERLKEVGH